VSQLFADHKDLLDEFTYFLPDTSSPWVMTQPYYPRAPQIAAPERPKPKEPIAPPQRGPPVVKVNAPSF
jgi:histone deacetylase complex regulatory component SIN3